MGDLSILIVDDESRMRKLIKDFLMQKNYNILEAEDGEMALKVYEENKEKINLILLDVMMPKLDGWSVLRQIRQENKTLPIVMLTARAEEQDELFGFELGVDEYITKPFSVRELMARVKANLRKAEITAKTMENGAKEKEAESSNTVVVGDLSIDLNKFEVKVRGEIIDLTLREFEVIKYLAAQPGQVVTRETLLEKVWGYEYYGDIRTVDVTVRRIREKIEKDTSNPKILITKRGVGYYIASREVAR